MRGPARSQRAPATGSPPAVGARRLRWAPRASRTLNSLVRAVARASSRFVTLAQAMQHQRADAHQDAERRQQGLLRAEAGLPDRQERHANAAVGIGIRLGEPLGERLHFRAALFEGDARFETNKGHEHACHAVAKAVAKIEIAGSGQFSEHGSWGPQIECQAGFCGSFDLAATRFSGRRAPERVGADPITREAYSHECCSAGFWPGGGDVTGPAFYSYAAPEPPGYAGCAVLPPAAFYHTGIREFILMYEDVRLAASPRAALLDFLQSTYDAAANLGNWDRVNLERPGGLRYAPVCSSL